MAALVALSVAASNISFVGGLGGVDVAGGDETMIEGAGEGGNVCFGVRTVQEDIAIKVIPPMPTLIEFLSKAVEH